MDSEPIIYSVVNSSLVALSREQSQVNCILPTDEESTIKKVLCTNAKSYIENSEIVGNVINYNGSVTFQLVFVDDLDAIKSLDYTVLFKDSFTTETEITGGVPIVTSVVQDVKLTGNTLTAIIDNNFSVILNDENKIIVGVGKDNVFSESDMIKHTKYIGVAREKFENSTTVEIKDDVTSILSVCQNVELNDVTTNVGSVNIKGKILLNILYLAGQSEVIRSKYSEYSFSRDIPLELVSKDTLINSVISIVINDTKITTTLDENSTAVEVFTPIEYMGYAFNPMEINGITDAYSTTNYVLTEFSNIEYLTNVATVNTTDKISGSIQIDDTSPFVDEVLGNCCNNVIITRSSIEDKTLVVEGIANTNILYYTKETKTITSVELEMPFQMEYCINATVVDPIINPIVTLTDLNLKSRRGKEIEVVGSIHLFATIFEPKQDAYMSAFKIGDLKPFDECVLSIYIVKENDTIWSIAKELGVSMDLILEQNPDIELPLLAGTKLVIFKPRIFAI